MVALDLSSALVPAHAAEDASLKKDKKKKKKKRAAPTPDGEAGQAPAQDTEAAPAANGEGPSSPKKRKKKRKATSEPEESAAPAPAHAIVTCGTFGKYTESVATASRPDAVVAEYRSKQKITCDAGTPRPMLTFSEYPWPAYITDNFSRSGFDAPTPIQAQGWPIALSGRDFVGVAATGSGKTLAYALPGIMHVKSLPRVRRGDGPVVLVLAPTRELAIQIEGEFSKFAASVELKITVCYGGAPKRDQHFSLKAGPSVVVATPGRLNDFLGFKATNMDKVSYLVLDEADRMLDMGFAPQIKQIIELIPAANKRQTLMWSATWPKEVRRLAEEYLQQDYTKLTIGEAELTANKNVKQEFLFCQGHEKQEKLAALMQTLVKELGKQARILVFVGMKYKVEEITQTMRKAGIRAVCMHGDKEQSQREWVLNAFTSGSNPVLVATDVAARGLDVKDVKAVVNFDLPGNSADYVHRIGRTGRAGALGVSHTIIAPPKPEKYKMEYKLCRDIAQLLKDAGQEVPDTLAEYAQRGEEIAPRRKWVPPGQFRGRGGGGGWRGGGGGRGGGGFRGRGGGGFRGRR